MNTVEQEKRIADQEKRLIKLEGNMVQMVRLLAKLIEAMHMLREDLADSNCDELDKFKKMSFFN